ncbi:MAG: carbohydrate ABC transporter substrate-binding protein [Anaerolineaceae bacterium]|nr:carbohydrate ABC transporter substrate-binding protein [Anaerolineaceae bacterium]
MFKKKALFFIIVIVMLLGACAPQTIEVTKEVPVEVEVIKEVEVVKEVEVEVIKEVEVDKSPLTITIPWTGDAMELFLPVVEGFEAKSGIEVKVLPYKTEDLGPLLPAQFMAEEPMADVMIMSWPWWIEQNSEHLVDITDLTTDIEFLGNPVVKDDVVYGMPSYLWLKPGFWYRKSVFEANGLTQPETWEEFLTLVEDLRGIDGIVNPISTPSGYPIADMVENFIGTFGGPEMIQGIIDGDVKWTDPEVKAIFAERIVPLLESEAFSDPVDRHACADLWWEGDYALHFYGNWVSEDVDDPSDIGILTLPGATTVVGGSDWMFIPKYTDRIDDAKAFIAYVISEEGMAIRLAQGGRLSSRADVSLDLYPPAEKTLAAAISEFVVLPDLDDTIGGEWQSTFWDQTALLWVQPSSLDDVLEMLQEKMPE